MVNVSQQESNLLLEVLTNPFVPTKTFSAKIFLLIDRQGKLTKKDLDGIPFGTKRKRKPRHATKNWINSNYLNTFWQFTVPLQVPIFSPQ